MEESRLDEFINKMSADINNYVRELHEKQLIADIILIYRTYGDYCDYRARVEIINEQIRKDNESAMLFKPGELKPSFTYKVERPLLNKRIFDFIKSLSETTPSIPIPYSLESEETLKTIDTTSAAEAWVEYRKFMDSLYTDAFKWTREPLCEDETEVKE